MVKLSDDWLTGGILDIEYKQYELLAYLQKVDNKFNEVKIYPYFSDIMTLYEDLTIYRETKQMIVDGFPKRLIEISLSESKLKYEDLVVDTPYIKDIDNLVVFALIELRKQINKGKSIYDEVEDTIDILELGTVHFSSKQGFFIIHDETIDVYQYEIGSFYNANGTKALRTKLIRSYPIGHHLSYESIRIDLIEGTKLTIPSTFIIDSSKRVPIEETLLPIAKRLLLKKLLLHQK